MKLFFASLTLCLCAAAQTVTTDPANPTLPASLSVFADKGDLTYCAATAVKGTKPLIQLTCRRSGITHFTVTYIDSTTVVDNGDVSWSFIFNNAGNPQQVAFQASANVRDTTGQIVTFQVGTVNQEFQIGESVKDSTGTKTGTVLHWLHQTGQQVKDGQTTPLFYANLYLTNTTGTFAVNDQLVSASGATGTAAIVNTPPVLNPILKSSGLITWPSPTKGKRNVHH
jgi:hypothetical protein